ncbi:MAG: hypothetical protein H6707_10195 [Deltaproteobacteria bacterium]|nr:hypothetical protein [Deltaproteobacteria bacterium]
MSATVDADTFYLHSYHAFDRACWQQALAGVSQRLQDDALFAWLVRQLADADLGALEDLDQPSTVEEKIAQLDNDPLACYVATQIARQALPAEAQEIPGSAAQFGTAAVVYSGDLSVAEELTVAEGVLLIGGELRATALTVASSATLVVLGELRCAALRCAGGLICGANLWGGAIVLTGHSPLAIGGELTAELVIAKDRVLAARGLSVARWIGAADGIGLDALLSDSLFDNHGEIDVVALALATKDNRPLLSTMQQNGPGAIDTPNWCKLPAR